MNCIRTFKLQAESMLIKNIINWIHCENYAFELTLRRLSRKSVRFVRAITACDNGFSVLKKTDYCGFVSARWVNKRKYSDEMYKSPFIDRNDEKKRSFSRKHLTRNSRQSVCDESRVVTNTKSEWPNDGRIVCTATVDSSLIYALRRQWWLIREQAHSSALLTFRVFSRILIIRTWPENFLEKLRSSACTRERSPPEKL